MLENIGNIKGLEIYTPDGIFVGAVDEVLISIPEMSVKGLFVADANPALVDEGVSINIPVRWVQSVGDIIILNRFPNERIGPGSA
ncbi:MAG: PRC-barrel domain-containing protein [Methanomassiliicoccaceae archaeon]|nr:PRC-barrel domain-containing protein [Methanomassiliicoccaceae archaeon]MCL2145964.1 PRC-barrel domain-containing protein [Methanomassiliicoccaceae archaeon]